MMQQKNYRWLVFLLPLLVFAPLGCNNTAQPPASDAVVSSLPFPLHQAEKFIAEGKNDRAAKNLQKWLDDHPDSPHREYALYLQGQAYYNQGKYYDAFTANEELLENHSDSRFYDELLVRQVDIARELLAGYRRYVWGFIPTTARSEALELLDRVVSRWPGSELAAQALMMKADYFYNEGRFLEAQQAYQFVVDEYPHSDHYRRALLRNAEATHALYEGPLYDNSSLEDARIRYEQYRARFPRHARDIGIDQRIEQIRQQQAYKAALVADYYQRTDEPQAADYYHQVIRHRWPEYQTTDPEELATYENQ